MLLPRCASTPPWQRRRAAPSPRNHTGPQARQSVWRRGAGGGGGASGSEAGGGSSDGNSGGGRSIRELMTDVGRPILTGPRLVLSQDGRKTLDARPAAEFYARPRIGVHHETPEFLESVTGLYRRVLSALLPKRAAGAAGAADAATTAAATAPQRLRILDLCSSWASHLGPDLARDLGLDPSDLEVIGHGANAEELAANPALSSWFVQDLDCEPRLASIASGSVDAVLCCNSVYYLTRIEEVAAEVARVLAPRRGAFVVVFGRDCFRGRALAAYLERSLEERAELLRQVLLANGFASVDAQCDPALGLASLVATAAAPPPPELPPLGLSPQTVPAVLFSPTISSPLPGLGPVGGSEGGGGGSQGSGHKRGGGGGGGGGGDVRDARRRELAVMEWRLAYGALCADAAELGIPVSAIPRLPDDDSEVTIEVVQAKQKYLQDMVASFLSAGL